MSRSSLLARIVRTMKRLFPFIRIKYNAYNGDYYPPAATCDIIVSTILGHQIGLGEEATTKLTMILDTGADISCVPKTIIEYLQKKLGALLPYDLVDAEGFNGEKYNLKVYDLKIMAPEGCCFTEDLVEFAEVDADEGILGRDVLNKYLLFFDGPSQTWTF